MPSITSKMISAAREHRAVFSLGIYEELDLQGPFQSFPRGRRKKADYLIAGIVLNVGFLYALVSLLAAFG